MTNMTRLFRSILDGFRSLNLSPPVRRDPGIVTMPADQLAELWESNEPDDAPGLRAAVDEFKRARHWDESDEDRLARFRIALRGRRSPCPIHKPMPCSEDCPNSTDAYAKRERDRLMAEAWDQGWDAHCPDPSRHRLRKTNPYREKP